MDQFARAAIQSGGAAKFPVAGYPGARSWRQLGFPKGAWSWRRGWIGPCGRYDDLVSGWVGVGVNMVDRFPLCLPWTLRQENVIYTGTPSDWSNPKNFSNDRHDPGGKTQCGIIQREYDLWRKGHGLGTQDIRKITAEEGEAIYRVAYWQPHCSFIPPGLDLSFFDESVNAGPTEALRVLQVSLGVGADGEWGPQTAAAATLAVNDLVDHIERFTSRRIEVYKEMPGFKYFGTDWVRRATEIGQTALNMARSENV